MRIGVEAEGIEWAWSGKISGTLAPWLSVDRGLYRLQLLNGSNARIYKVAWSDGRPFHLVATDGGLLPAPVAVTSVPRAPGQRLEILVDFSAYAAGARGFNPILPHDQKCSTTFRHIEEAKTDGWKFIFAGT